VLELVDLVVSLRPHRLRYEVLHANDQDILVVRAVEDPEQSACGNGLVNAPQIVVAQLQRCRRLEWRYLAAERVARPKYLADGTILSSCVTSLEDHQHRVSGIGIERRLQLTEPLQQVVRLWLQLVVVRELGRPRGRAIIERERRQKLRTEGGGH
jgi:hypothetical protein